jgi:hypothetical protein
MQDEYTIASYMTCIAVRSKSLATVVYMMTCVLGCLIPGLVSLFGVQYRKVPSVFLETPVAQTSWGASSGRLSRSLAGPGSETEFVHTHEYLKFPEVSCGVLGSPCQKCASGLLRVKS